jgi:hypothetical protein
MSFYSKNLFIEGFSTKKLLFGFCIFIHEKWQTIRQKKSTPFEIHLDKKLSGRDS